MQTNTGRFEMDPVKVEAMRADWNRMQVGNGGPQVPFPDLAVDEIVQIKGVDFRVCRIKADGKLGLKMCKRS